MNFTIGADGSAFAGALGKLQEPLNKIGQAFMGLQGIAAGLRTAFSAAMVPIQAFGAVENVQTSMEVLLGNKDAAESLTRSLQRMSTCPAPLRRRGKCSAMMVAGNAVRQMKATVKARVCIVVSV